MTYSINPGTTTQATNWNDINTILNELPDNITGLINPINIRDSIYTTWENIALKQTINYASIPYIGIDQTNLYSKIFLGKKQLSNSDILTTNLLNSDVDIFFYNTKTDTNLSNQNTKIGFLAGTSQSIFYYGNTLSIPYIETKFLNVTGGNVLDFNVINNSSVLNGATHTGGNITIKSAYGNLLLNGLVLPTYTQNLPANVVDNSVLLYKNIGGIGYLQWGSSTSSTTSINTTGTFSITANPLLINGYDAMFSSSVPVPITLGGITSGSTFSNVSVTEMLRMLLYPYLPPSATLTSPISFIEITTSVLRTINFSYSITKIVTSTISNINTGPIFITSTSAPLAYLNVPGVNITWHGAASYSSISYFSSTGIKPFTLSVVDNFGGSSSVEYDINSVYPIFYGTSTTATSSQTGVQSLIGAFSKILTNNPNQTIPVSGNGVCIYYCVPEIYNISASMSSLYDSNAPSFNIKNVFNTNGTPFTMSLNSPTSGYWSGVTYNCYIYSPFGMPAKTTIGNPSLYTANYQFNF